MIQRELKKFRKKHQAAATAAANTDGSSKDSKDSGECSRGLSMFGDPFDLDEFHGDSDEDFRDQAENTREQR